MAKRAGATWSQAELRRFLAGAGADRLAACWRMTLYGLRRGEVAGLRWDAVDLDAGTITIGLARVLVYGRVVVKAPKSDRGYRTLPLDPDLVAALRVLRKQQAAERLAAGQAYAGARVCRRRRARRARSTPSGYTDEFGRIATAAGLPRIRLHDARHTMNSLLAAAGVPDHVRAAWCGHTVAVNVSTYTHARPEDLVAARDVLAGICPARTRRARVTQCDRSGPGASAGPGSLTAYGPGLRFGGALGGTRTPNLLIRSQMLYPLSYERRS